MLCLLCVQVSPVPPAEERHLPRPSPLSFCWSCISGSLHRTGWGQVTTSGFGIDLLTVIYQLQLNLIFKFYTSIWAAALQGFFFPSFAPFTLLWTKYKHHLNCAVYGWCLSDINDGPWKIHTAFITVFNTFILVLIVYRSVCSFYSEKA